MKPMWLSGEQPPPPEKMYIVFNAEDYTVEGVTHWPREQDPVLWDKLWPELAKKISEGQAIGQEYSL